MQKSQLAKDRQKATLPIDKKVIPPELENEVYKKTIEKMEEKITEYDKELKDLKLAIHKTHMYSAEQLVVFRKSRRKLKKVRDKLKMELDLLRK